MLFFFSARLGKTMIICPKETISCPKTEKDFVLQGDTCLNAEVSLVFLFIN